MKLIFANDDYLKNFGFLEFVLRHSQCPNGFANRINSILENAGAAYRVWDGNIIIPVSSDVEGATLERAFADLAATEFHGARTHLRGQVNN